jgi:predicted NACHT family NTPase
LYLLNEINKNERLKEIIQTPLMLSMLIAVVLKEGKIPYEKGKIIRAFMLSLYLREQKQIIDFDIEIFHMLLCYLGFETRDLTGSNSGLDRDEFIIPLLEQRKNQLGIPINLIDFLRKATDLNIIVNDNNQYSFSHELYQEYYAAEHNHKRN